MTATGLSAPRQIQIAFEQARQRVGWTGLCGTALILAAAVLFAQALSDRKREPIAAPVQPTIAAVQVPVAAQPQVQAARPLVELPPSEEIPLLLTQIKQIAVNNGLGWTSADYRLIGATSTLPASFEVKTQFKAPYPNLRRMVDEVLKEVPASTLRELSFSRANGDVAAVEAKILIVVFLRGAPETATETVMAKDRP